MRRGFSILALALALLLAMTGCSMVELNEERDGQTVVAVVGGEEIYKKDFKETLNRTLMQSGIDPESTDSGVAEYVSYISTTTLNALVNQKIMLIKAKEMGLDTLTEEEQATVQASYDDTIATLKESAEATITQQNTDNNVTMSEAEFNTAVDKEIDAAFEAMYFTRESYMDYLELYAIMDKVQDKVTEGLAPTEEQIQTAYDEKVAAAKEDYEETPKNYESAFVNGSVIYYVPDGVRVVQHILIGLTDEQQKELSTLRSEDKNDEADAKRAEYLVTIKAEADEVLGKISADHANFLDVMKENSDDTASADGMEFAVAPGGGYYAEDFMNAALAMKEVGEMSGLVASDFGYHIMLCTQIPTSGAVPLGDVKDSISEQLLSEMQTEKLTETLATWTEELSVKTYTDRLS